MRRTVLYILLGWAIITLLATPALLYYRCPIDQVRSVIEGNAIGAILIACVMLVMSVPRAINAPTQREMQAKVDQLLRAEKELRHANRDLQQQLLYRGVLERELSIMRTLQFARNQQEIEKSIKTLDRICDELRSLMPEKYRNAPVPANGPFPSRDEETGDQGTGYGGPTPPA